MLHIMQDYQYKHSSNIQGVKLYPMRQTPYKEAVPYKEALAVPCKEGAAKL